MTVTALPERYRPRRASIQLEFTSETPYASVRAAGGCLGIPEPTQYHMVVGQSPDPLDDHLIRRHGRETVETARARRLH